MLRTNKQTDRQTHTHIQTNGQAIGRQTSRLTFQMSKLAALKLTDKKKTLALRLT